MKKHKKQPVFEIIYDPYRYVADDTFDVKLQRYIDDADAVYVQNGRSYYRAFTIIRTTVKGQRLIAALSNKISLTIDDSVIDDRGNGYVVKGIKLIRLLSDAFPEWYKIISFVILQGMTENVGEYFAKQDMGV